MIAAVGLPAQRATYSVPRSGSVDDGTWPDLLAFCGEHRLLGVLAEATRFGSVVLGERQRVELESRYRNWLVHDLVVESTLLRATDVLHEAGISFRVLKGVALAHGLYPDPSMRVFADADLLVESVRCAEASAVLIRNIGATRVLPELRPGFDERFGREVLVRVGAVELDLHRTLVDGPYGLWVPLGELFDDPVQFDLGGTALPGLGPVAQFVHSCLSAVLGDWPPRLIVLRDLAEMLVGGPGRAPVDAEAVLGCAKRWKAEAVVALAVRRTVDDLGLVCDHPLVEWARTYRPSIRDRVLIASYRGRARGYTSQALSVLAIGGWRNRWDYLRAIVRPDRAYLEARGFRRGDRLLRALGVRRRARRTSRSDS